ncbi:uncharacterized protein BDR25DRAFT_334370 [Lindgomyces ingoldianus]|uniref:Uncharacterized protein n=1 Tax=Lindgomyces ingoldianus TaxID=673940 RepID=A0ACB6QTC6_9PLEO|nr:uncharacterized protein BDR25DRAFT_334370 [Lindgomyces ingoldianus]KAF2470268.1 hypothetical protein BDR25DRAFT_334370 [Lindgomyces ingoldianus]
MTSRSRDRRVFFERHPFSSGFLNPTFLPTSLECIFNPFHDETTTPTLPTRSQWNAKLNPPECTYAPELNIPTRQPGQMYFSYLFSCGKAYIAFYKSGISHVRSTARLAKSLGPKARMVGAGSAVLTRAEWQVIRRSRRDMLRLPAFGILVLVMGEWLPLIALWITPLVPEVCRIPAQVRKELEKLEKTRRERVEKMIMSVKEELRLEGRHVVKLRAPQTVQVEEVRRLSRVDLISVSAKLDAHSRVLDYLPRIGPVVVALRWGLERKLRYLCTDDDLIMKDGGWQGLGKEEVRRACVDRGIDVLGRSEAEMRKGLAGWFDGRRDTRSRSR